MHLKNCHILLTRDGTVAIVNHGAQSIMMNAHAEFLMACAGYAQHRPALKDTPIQMAVRWVLRKLRIPTNQRWTRTEEWGTKRENRTRVTITVDRW